VEIGLISLFLSVNKLTPTLHIFWHHLLNTCSFTKRTIPIFSTITLRFRM